ncbi:unnamed protein product [Brassica rapa subsp. narinosa]
MKELGSQEQLYQTWYEPSGHKIINNYFNLRWIEIIKESLSDVQQEMLAESHFRQIMLMGGGGGIPFQLCLHTSCCPISWLRKRSMNYDGGVRGSQ